MLSNPLHPLSYILIDIQIKKLVRYTTVYCGGYAISYKCVFNQKTNFRISTVSLCLHEVGLLPSTAISFQYDFCCLYDEQYDVYRWVSHDQE